VKKTPSKTGNTFPSPIHRVDLDLGGRRLSFETGRMARQADGSVYVQYQDTAVLVAAQSADLRRDLGFFPLTIDYREKTAAVGKFPGGFFKREGRPTTKEILTCRLTDRPIRPLFPDGYKKELQVQTLVLSSDQKNDPDILSMNGAFAALSVANVPFMGPLGAVRVGRVDGEFVLMPTQEDLQKSDLDLVVASSKDAIVMVEAAAKEVPDEVVLEALFFGFEAAQPIIEAIEELQAKVGPVKEEVQPPEVNEDCNRFIEKTYRKELEAGLTLSPKRDSGQAIRALRKQILEDHGPDSETGEVGSGQYESKDLMAGFGKLEKAIVRDMILKKSLRIDGRGLQDIRPIHSDVNVLPRTHGSALFTRGETQALVSTTLGSARDQQKVDGLLDPVSKRFMLHYNFPPFCVGDVRPIRGPGRREIGHGDLAERSLAPVLPDASDFSYTIRLISEILESNGSSSMASVCGGTMALMDAGVPIRRPVAGIAMGLVSDGKKKFQILSDILGTEDYCGDMDFKVAGTTEGVTAMQLDCKVAGVSKDVMRQALEQAREGRLHILGEMLTPLERPRRDISIFAPRTFRIQINPEKISLVIGSGGKTIRSIQEETGANIEIEDDGTVEIFCVEMDGAETAKKRVEDICAEAEVGKLYFGKVNSIKDFGAFVEILPKTDGLVHVSELAEDFVGNVRDVVREGEEIWVKVLSIDDLGRVKLSKKVADREMASRKGS
jgi:polyribonucleotide nucleotidyltransferase